MEATANEEESYEACHGKNPKDGRIQSDGPSQDSPLSSESLKSLPNQSQNLFDLGSQKTSQDFQDTTSNKYSRYDDNDDRELNSQPSIAEPPFGSCVSDAPCNNTELGGQVSRPQETLHEDENLSERGSKLQDSPRENLLRQGKVRCSNCRNRSAAEQLVEKLREKVLESEIREQHSMKQLRMSSTERDTLKNSVASLKEELMACFKRIESREVQLQASEALSEKQKREHASVQTKLQSQLDETTKAWKEAASELERAQSMIATKDETIRRLEAATAITDSLTRQLESVETQLAKEKANAALKLSWKSELIERTALEQRKQESLVTELKALLEEECGRAKEKDNTLRDYKARALRQYDESQTEVRALNLELNNTKKSLLHLQEENARIREKFATLESSAKELTAEKQVKWN